MIQIKIKQMSNKESRQKSLVWSGKDSCDLKKDLKEVKKQTRWCGSVEAGERHSTQRDQKVQRSLGRLGMLNWY